MIAIRFLHGLEQHKPVGGLFALGLVTVGSALAFANRPHRSRRGKAVLSGGGRSYELTPAQVTFDRTLADGFTSAPMEGGTVFVDSRLTPERGSFAVHLGDNSPQLGC